MAICYDILVINEIFIGVVKDLSSKGHGVVEHSSGRIIFVPGVFPGDEGRFKIYKIKKRYGFANLIELIVPASYRVPSVCEHAGLGSSDCGGCPWIEVEYKKQLSFKDKHTKTQLDKWSLGVSELKSIQPSPKVLGYRQRAQLKTDGLRIGYVSPVSKVLAPIEKCAVLSVPLQKLLESIDVKQMKESSHLTSISLDSFEGVTIGQRSTFRQANEEQNQFMKDWLLSELDLLSEKSSVVELFSGSGNFTSIINQSEAVGEIHAYECVESAVTELREKIPEVRSHVLDLFEESSLKREKKNWAQATVLILDPPRVGYELLSKVVSSMPHLEAIFYISCDVNSFCKDVSGLAESGWGIETLQPVDQFPHTPHIELLAALKRNKS